MIDPSRRKGIPSRSTLRNETAKSPRLNANQFIDALKGGGAG
jgi:hypothetical protein